MRAVKVSSLRNHRIPVRALLIGLTLLVVVAVVVWMTWLVIVALSTPNELDPDWAPAGVGEIYQGCTDYGTRVYWSVNRDGISVVPDASCPNGGPR